MPTWILWISSLWPLAITITPFILGGGFLWLKTQFASATDIKVCHADIAAIKLSIARVESDIEVLGKADDSEPTRMKLMTQLSEVGHRLSRIEANAEAERRQSAQQYHALERALATNAQYLHTVIEQGLMRGPGQ